MKKIDELTLENFKFFRGLETLKFNSKNILVYGENGSGKSNLLEAMGFMRQTVLNSFRDALLDNSERKFPLEKFALNTKSEKDISYFEISFFQNHTKYRYGFEIDYDKIVDFYEKRRIKKQILSTCKAM